MSVECGFDVIVTGSVGIRRLGFEDFRGSFFVGSREGVGEDSFLFPLFRSGDPIGTFPPFDEIPILLDVVEVFFGKFGGLDVRMIVPGIEESSIGGVELLRQGDEGMEVRIAIFVFFFGDADVERITGREFVFQEVNQGLGSLKTAGIGQKDVFRLKSVSHGYTLEGGS